jgi:mono/diheme cytochrome c family protein
MKLPASINKRAVISASVMALVLAVMPSAAPAAGDPEKARPIFDQMCAGCHGTQGNGQEGTKSGFVPRVATLANKAYMASVPDDYLTMVIKKGGAYMGKIASMPAWETKLSEEQISDIVALIRTFTN